MGNYRSNWLVTVALFILIIVIINAMVAALPGAVNALDPESTNPVRQAMLGRILESTNPVRRAT